MKMGWSYWKNEHSLPFSWPVVSSGYWWRYPNPESNHVSSVDTIESEMRGDILYTKRILLKTNSLPVWGKHFFKDATVAVIEESLVDRAGHSLTWYTRNIGLNRFMSTVEKATFTPSVELPDKETRVEKECWIDSSIFGFRSAIKNFGVGRYKRNCLPATRGFKWALDNHLDGSRPFNKSGQLVTPICEKVKDKEIKDLRLNIEIVNHNPATST